MTDVNKYCSNPINENNKIKLKQTIEKYKTDNKNCVNKIKNKLTTKIEKKINIVKKVQFYCF